MRPGEHRGRGWALLRRLVVTAVALLMTVAVFLLLPLIESIGQSPVADTTIRGVDTADVPPPPTPPPPSETEPERPPEPPPELTETAPPLDLSQLEMALDPGFGAGSGISGDYAIRLDGLTQSAAADTDALFSIADLDQEPRALSQAGPMMTAELRRKAPGTVHIVFVVDQQGRVQDPIVQKASDPAFERPALQAIKQWRFEPGKKAGKPVRFRMRVPFTFPKS